MASLQRITINGFRGARDVALEPGRLCVLVGESSSGQVDRALRDLGAPRSRGADADGRRHLARPHARARRSGVCGERTLFLDARPPSTLNLNREGAPPSLFFPASRRPTTLLAPTDHESTRAVRIVRDDTHAEDGGLALDPRRSRRSSMRASAGSSS